MLTPGSRIELIQEALNNNEMSLDVSENVAWLLEDHERLLRQVRELTADLQHTSDLVDFVNPPSRL